MTTREFYNADCYGGMVWYPDNYFDLAIVDPPYFSGQKKREYYGRDCSATGVKRVNYPIADQCWEVPGEDYFGELFRVSKHQIVWGCNYFAYPFGPGRIIWDKCNGRSSFSDCEIAYCSMQGKSVEEGHIMQGNKKLNEKRIHPTQKPVNLYRWQLQRYAKPGQRILDTHTGSASSLIAFEEFGCEYVAFEKDPVMYEKAEERLIDWREHRKEGAQ